MTVPERGSQHQRQHRARARPGDPVGGRYPLRRLLRVTSVACGIQFGWALQLSLLTPYVQELGIPHAWASVVWLCGPLSGFLVQPLVGHTSDRCNSKYGRRRPFIVAGATMIALAVLVIGHSADIGWWFGDRGSSRPRAIAAFVVGFWLLDVANNTTQGPCRALLADLTVASTLRYRRRYNSKGEFLFVQYQVSARVGGADWSMTWVTSAAGRWHAKRKTKISVACNVLGFATGSYSGWYNLFPFTVTSACNANCANLKSAFFLDITFIVITTYVSVSAAQELPIGSTNRYAHVVEDGLQPSENSSQEAFLWELFGTFRYLSGSIWMILFVTALTWIGWFPFLLFDTDWMGREVYGGDPGEGKKYHAGVRMGAFGLMLNSVVLGITSLLMEKLCRKLGAGFLWGISNIFMALCFSAMLIISSIVRNMDLASDVPPVGVVVAAILVFASLGAPLAITYSVPYAMISTRIESLGLGQGLSMGVLNLAIVIPQVVVSLGSGPWDQLFGGGNSPSLAVAAIAAFVSGLIAILALPRSRPEKPRSHA
ncbi:hypothetical protein RJ641_029835 [Dillenia turbinata]|uniref:Major facilitator superfamily (MFS) profile domain-containing protein n=1 Tax=Dillenia turbinata TaxID=194707 RepID=A0AAN8ZGK7_9MAGN